jgi:hypothetical protein
MLGRRITGARIEIIDARDLHPLVNPKPRCLSHSAGAFSEEKWLTLITSWSVIRGSGRYGWMAGRMRLRESPSEMQWMLHTKRD